MKFSASLPLPAHLLLLGARRALGQGALNNRQAEDDYIISVCSPATAPDQADPAPCIAIQNIETACLPNGTSSLALEAHAQCLCGGSYFAEWLGCRRCLEAHGALSQRNYTYFSAVLSSASELLCDTPTPAAPFAELFTQAQAGIPEPTTGGTALTDVSSGDAAVSLYYTASGPQGPGPITGSATAATASPTDSSSSSGSGSGSTGGTTLGPGIGSGTNTAAETSPSSSNIAVPTGVAGGKGALFAAAVGGALVAVL